MIRSATAPADRASHLPRPMGSGYSTLAANEWVTSNWARFLSSRRFSKERNC
jgi:hypothetical protein